MGHKIRQRAEREAQNRLLDALPAQLKPIYDALPALDCKGLCHACCGPINWGTHEAALAERLTGKPAFFVQHGTDIRCTYLDPETKRCEVYDVRPLICRLYGLVEKMRCPHGCEPERWLTDGEASMLLIEVKGIVGGYLSARASASVDPWIREFYERVEALERRQRLTGTRHVPVDSSTS